MQTVAGSLSSETRPLQKLAQVLAKKSDARQREHFDEMQERTKEIQQTIKRESLRYLKTMMKEILQNQNMFEKPLRLSHTVPTSRGKAFEQ